MVQKLEEMIEEGIVTELELVEFISMIKKLSSNGFIDVSNVELYLKHFGFNEKTDGYIEIKDGTEYKI